MAKSVYEPGIFVIPKNGYKVSETTAAVVDCMRMHDAFYSKVSHVLEVLYGDVSAEKRLDEKYFPNWSELEDLLQEELRMSIVDNLMDIKNSQNENEIIL